MRKHAIVGWIVVLCLALGFGASTSLGQAVFGSIIGTVTDPQSNAVAGAKVTVTSVTKSFTYETTTNESGNYSVTHLIPDTYKIRVESKGLRLRIYQAWQCLPTRQPMSTYNCRLGL
jgi:Carboxypeptidase regulatory-like domain